MRHLIILNDIESLIVLKALKNLRKKRFASELDKAVCNEVIDRIHVTVKEDKR